MRYMYLKGLRYKQILKNLLNTFGEQYPSYETLKIWTAGLKRGKFSVEEEGQSGWLIFVSTPINTGDVHDMTLLDRHIRLKLI